MGYFKKILFTKFLWMMLIVYILVEISLILTNTEFRYINNTKLLLEIIYSHYFEFLIFGLLIVLYEYYICKKLHDEFIELLKYNERLSSDSSALENKIKIMKGGILDKLNYYFSEWKLSEAECEIAILILKGFSFKEIGLFRKTKEKTIGEQAMKIYAKSGLKNRSELLGFFLIELLEILN